MKYRIHWNYGAPGTRPVTGGEYVIKANTPDEAISEIKTQISVDRWTQPFNIDWVDIVIIEPLVGSLSHSQVIEALKTLSPDELAALLKEVAAP